MPVTERLLQFAEIPRFTALVVQVGISPFDSVIGGKQPSYSAVGVYTFSTASLDIIVPFLRRLVLASPVVTGATCNNQHNSRLDRPPIVLLVGELPCWDTILPILVRLELLLPVNTAAILQQSALLWVRSSPYSADGGETTLFGGYTALFYAVGTHGHSNDKAASSTTVGATTPLKCGRGEPPCSGGFI